MPDWILSLEPRFVSTAFAASMAISHLLAGLAALLVAGTGDDQARRDLSALTVAAALGLLYLDLMQFIVLFDGNLPDRVRALAERSGPVWLGLAVLGWLLATVVPVVALGSPRLQRSPTAQRAAAGSALIGLSLRALWLVRPARGSILVEGPAFGLALAAVGLLLLATSRARGRADV
jgi:hypothetical protein